LSQGQRSLAAIMFTDMVGYTALAQSNEERAMEVLERHNRLLRPFFPKFRGREVKAIGDSFLVEFGSSLDAVKCAIEVQSFLHDYNLSSGGDWKIMLRIGVHLGDVIHQGDDVFGDAVNIASRLQPLAEPEGVCVSDQVFGQVGNKIAQRIVKLPPQELKHVSMPIEVFKVVMPWDRESVQMESGLDQRRVAVLPFANLSPDPNDEFFADGLTEELMDRLAQIKELEVIARTSVMSYKKKESKASEIGRELRAGALVEGSVRKAGNKIRVTAQLINANTESHLWSSRYDRDLQDVFAVQTEIAEQVAGALKVQLVTSERKSIGQKPTESLEAYTLYLRGRFLWNKRETPAVKEALRLFQEAVQKDRGYAKAFAGIADCYSILVDRQEVSWSESGPKAKEAAQKAIELDPSLPEAHASLGLVLVDELDYKGAEAEFNRAIELNPGYASAYQWYSVLLAREGRLSESDRAIAMAERADPLSTVILYNAGYTAWVNGRDAEAMEKWNRALEINPRFTAIRLAIASYYANKHMKHEAKEELKLLDSIPFESPGEAMIRNSGIALLCGRMGEEEEANRRIQILLAGTGDEAVSPGFLALAYAGLGDSDRFFDLMEKAAGERSSITSMLRGHPLLAEMRADPRYPALLAKLGLPP
jgi:adenylate cyclase